ncbi:MAG: choice-of-anchor tandem repeat GloVer-containing protein [Luteolibacter sp.]
MKPTTSPIAILSFVLLVIASLTLRSAAQVYEKVISFTDALANGPPARPNAGGYPSKMIEGPGGDFFGFCDARGQGPSVGLIAYRVTKEGTLTTFGSLWGVNSSTAEYRAGFEAVGYDGNLYGLSQNSGTAGFGSIFKMTPTGVSTMLVEFTGQSGPKRGATPNILIRTRDGSFVGSTKAGGTYGCGTLFKMTASGVFTPVVDFSGNSGAQRGNGPVALMETADGSLCGITTGGGLNSMGTVFKVRPNGEFVIITDFEGSTGSHRGTGPNMLSQARDGTLFGVTATGGSSNLGTVFRIAADQHLVVADVPPDHPGIKFLFEKPEGGYLALASDPGFYYDVALNGVLSPVSYFSGASFGSGRYLNTVVPGRDGNLYGAVSDNLLGPFGFIFKLSLSGEYATLHAFTGDILDNNGRDPQFLAEGSDGNFYGTAGSGGQGYPLAGNNGTIFRITTGGVFETLVHFGLPAYSNLPISPRAAVIKGSDGNIYGTSFKGGPDNLGTVFSVTAGGELDLVKGFSGNSNFRGPGRFNGLFPVAELVEDENGSFFGVTTTDRGRDAIHSALIFNIRSNGESSTFLSGLYDQDTSPTGLIKSDDGFFYGTTPSEVLQINRIGGSRNQFEPWQGGTVLANLATTSNLVESSDAIGRFFYVAGGNSIHKVRAAGGDETFATLTEPTSTYSSDTTWQNLPIPPKTGIFQISFTVMPKVSGMNGVTGIASGPAGDYPDLACIVRLNPNGYFDAYNDLGYAKVTTVTYQSYQSYNVVITVNLPAKTYSATVNGEVIAQNYKFRSSQNSVTSLDHLVIKNETGSHEVRALSYGSGGDGRIIRGLVLGGDGYLYGTAEAGGAWNHGTVFKISSDGHVAKIVDFTGNGSSDRGDAPTAALIKRSDGFFYGTTSRGGGSDLGTVFRMNSAGDLTTLFDFENDPLDSVPLGRLTLDNDNNLYGTTSGGAGGAGSVYRLVFDGAPAIYPLPGQAVSLGSYRVRGKFNARGAASTAKVEYWSDLKPAHVIATINVSFNGYETHEFATTLPNLDAGATYFYQFVASNIRGNSPPSPVFSFRTSGLPSATLGAATAVTPVSAVINASVNARNAETAVSFEYGTDGVEFPFRGVAGTPATVSGQGDVTVSAAIPAPGMPALIPGTLYYFRVRGNNSAGEILVGPGTFATLQPPQVVLGNASPVANSTTIALLEGTVNARGSVASVYFDFRVKPDPGETGGEFEPRPATPSTVSGSEIRTVTRSLDGLAQGVTYEYRLRADGPGGIGTSGTGTFTMNVLSGLLQHVAGPAPAANGLVIVSVSPSLPEAAWRFAGEKQWRSVGIANPAQNLEIGDRLVEFRPVPGYYQPLPEQVSVTTGTPVVFLERSYFPLTGGGNDRSLKIRLKPESLATAFPTEKRGQWKLQGENNWRDSEDVASSLYPGNYLVEFKQVEGFSTPSPVSVKLAAGETTPPKIVTYRQADATVGSRPAPVPFETVSGSAALPYQWVGQLRSDAGSATGFVVKDRVVLTAAHVVFDDGTLSYVTGLNWNFQRDNGRFEPKPLLPRGGYTLTGYSARRILDVANPIYGEGVGSVPSQDRDVAALFFRESAGRGGYGGFLASESPVNEFLTSDAQKILIGYPVDRVDAILQGRMHATSPANIGFSKMPAAPPEYQSVQVYTTTGISSSGGNSGGPVCVRNQDGAYYPAAVYLGGSNQTVVRALDREVVNLIDKANVDAFSDDNGTGGGANYVSVGTSADTTGIGFLKVTASGGGWRMTDRDPAGFFRSGNVSGTLAVLHGTLTIKFTDVPGFLTPSDVVVQIVTGELSQVQRAYVPVTGFDAWIQPFNAAAPTGDSGPLGDLDHDGVINLFEYAFNMNPLASGYGLLEPGSGTGGLPIALITNDGATRRLEIEYVRRKASTLPGIGYRAEFAEALAGPWNAAPVARESVTPIDAGWERVRVPADKTFGTEPKYFGRVRVNQGAAPQ